jgi:hypothetical protein
VRHHLLAVAAAVLLAAGCGAHDASSQAPSSSPSGSPETTGRPSESTVSQTLVCSAFILGHHPTPEMRVLRNAVALQVWPETRFLRSARDGTPGEPRLFAKAPLLIRPGTPSTITVRQPSPGRLRIGWGNQRYIPARHVVVPACPDPDGTRWLVYPGGYSVDRRTCVKVTVRSGGAAESVRVPVGTPCR